MTLTTFDSLEESQQSVQFSSEAQSCPTPCNTMDCRTPGFPVHHHSQGLLKLVSIESVVSSNHLFLCHPFSSHLQSFPASECFQMSQFFASGGQSIGSFSISISPSSEYSGLISFRLDWLDPLSVQGTLKSLPQHQVQNHQLVGTQLSL